MGWSFQEWEEVMDGPESGRVLWAFRGYHGNPKRPGLNKQATNCCRDKLASGAATAILGF